MLQTNAQSSQLGSTITFGADPGFHFEIRVVSSDRNGITTELHVTAKRELNGATVECTGSTGPFMYIIQVAIGDSNYSCMYNCRYSNYTYATLLQTLQWLQVE